MTQPTNNLFTLDLQPVGRRVEISPGKTILEAAQEAGVGIVSLCGGDGWCNSCRVRIISGEVNDVTSNELASLTEDELSAGIRLACQVIPISDAVVDIPSGSLTTPQRLQVEGMDFQIEIDPNINYIDLEISPPSLDDLQSDTQRVISILSTKGYENVTIEFPMLSGFSDILRENNWKVRLAIRDSEIIAALPIESEFFGLAVDIGTTKVAIYLMNLETGEAVDKVGEMNPQIAFGEDVISRIAYSKQNDDGRTVMQQKLVETFNTKVAELCQKAKIRTGQIVDAVVVGNTAIHHLFAGLPVGQLVYAPYVPSVSEALDLRADGIGLKLAPGAYIHLLPNIAGYVGADHSAVLLATELWKTKKSVIAIDIGTNTEITLAANGRLLSCSCASGPAFEGAHIRHGMRAAPGAIEKIQIVGTEDVHLFTIEDQPPVGICGSGILDAVAELKETGVIDRRGAFVEDHPRVRKDSSNRQEYLLVDGEKSGHGRDVTVTRKDINEIQLAKGAIRAGLEILLDEAGIKANEIDEFIIAGAFGTYIDVGNAVKIGMFPDVSLDRFHQIGNAAGMGAQQALLSLEKRNVIQDVIEQVEYIELTTRSDFQDKFIKAMYLM